MQAVLTETSQCQSHPRLEWSVHPGTIELFPPTRSSIDAGNNT